MTPLDPRSLALFRILIGIILFSLGLDLVKDSDVFFSPHSIACGASRLPSSPWFYRAVECSLLLSALALIIGLYTKIAVLTAGAALFAVETYAPEITQGGDMLLRVLLFWSLFLPLNRKWALDLMRQTPSYPRLSFTATSADLAITIQVACLYWFAALQKTGALWVINGNALFFALQLQHFSTSFGTSLTAFPSFLRILTFASLGLEYLGPVLLFLPHRRGIFRIIAVFSFLFFHLVGMGLLLRIGNFPWVCASVWLIFLPNQFWSWLSSLSSTDLFRNVLRPTPSKVIKKRRDSRILDRLTVTLIFFGLVDIALWNVASISGSTYWQSWTKIDKLGETLGLAQRWNMYAPEPPSVHGWIVVPAELDDGTSVDLLTGKALDWSRPKDLERYFGDDFWRRYLSNIFIRANPTDLKNFAGYLKSRLESMHAPRHVSNLAIVFMRQQTNADCTVSIPERETLYWND